MEQYQRDQLQLQQYYQQQRIMELQMARQRQMEMEAQNVSRFSQMRERAIAAVAPMGNFVPSEAGMGRNISFPNSSGVASQSPFGTLVDATFDGGGLFFRTAGFQFNMTQMAVRQRARQALRVRQGQSFNTLRNAFVPQFLQRELGIVGMGNIEERSLEIMDAFAGLRGSRANPVTGRGILQRNAANIAQGFTQAVNQEFNGMLDSDAIGQLQSAALNTLDSRDIARVGGNNALTDSSATNLLTQIAKELQTVARNTGISTDRLGQIALDNKAMGNDRQDLVAMSRAVGGSLSTSDANREQQLRLGLSLTAQGRRMGVGDAGAFGQRMLQEVMDLQSAFNVGAVSRADLFRFGGGNPFEAAQRVVERQVQSGQVFAQNVTGTMGVLGRNLEQSLRGGLLGFTGDVAQAIVRNPFAPIIAETDFDTQQNLIENSTRLAMQEARNISSAMGIQDPAARRAYETRIVSQRLGRTPMDAAREMNLVRGMDRTVAIAVDKLGITGPDRDKLIDRISRGMSTFKRYGMSMDQVLQPSFLRRALASPNMDALDLIRQDVSNDMQQELLIGIGDQRTGEGALKMSRPAGSPEQLVEDAALAAELEPTFMPGIPGALPFGLNIHERDGRLVFGEYYDAGFGEENFVANQRRARVLAEFSSARLFETMKRNDLFTESFARMVRDQDLKGGTTDLGGTKQIMSMFESGQYDAIAQGVGPEGMQVLGRLAIKNFALGMTKVNEDAQKKSTLGATPQNPMYVRDATSAR